LLAYLGFKTEGKPSAQGKVDSKELHHQPMAFKDRVPHHVLAQGGKPQQHVAAALGERKGDARQTRQSKVRIVIGSGFPLGKQSEQLGLFDHSLLE
jgi:hypothetical protein